VINWSYNEDGSYRHVSILETYDKVDGFYVETATQIRVYLEGLVQIWRDDELYDEITTGYNFVPVIKVGDNDIPPMYDMAKMNISHMNRRSELDRYLRIAATPVPVIWGAEVDPQNPQEELVVGVDQVLGFKRVGEGDFAWREISGTATGALNEDLNFLEEQMVMLAMMLVSIDKTAQNKTAAQVDQETFESQSILALIAQQIEMSFTLAYAYVGAMGGQEQTIEIDKDFLVPRMQPDMIDKYLTMFREGIISLESLWDIFINSEVLPETFDKDNTLQALRI
jgi:hypothetical protein